MLTKKKLRLFFLLLLVLAMVLIGLFAPTEAWMQWLTAADAWRSPEGIALFVALYVIWNFALPPAPLQLLAGVHYGFGGGLLLVILATSIANIISHNIGRWLGRTWVAERVEDNAKLYALEKAIAQMGWKAVVLLRLSNLVPSNLANLLMGATPLKLPTILWATVLGSLPGWALMLFLGQGSRSFLQAEARAETPWILYLTGAVAAVALLAIIGRKAMQILEQEGDYTQTNETSTESPLTS